MSSDKQDETTVTDPRYAPPYPQSFHEFWPRHAIQAGAIVIGIIVLIAGLAYFYRVPFDYSNVFPDDGMYIPGPEWYYLFFLQPFWYLKGDLAKWQFIPTAVIPAFVVIFIVLVPFVFKRRNPLSGFVSRLLILLPPLAVYFIVMGGIVLSGYQSKLHGCLACHNPTTGVRQNRPPMDVAAFYKLDRQRQIAVGKYRASKTGTEGESVIGQEVETYKDANCQLRHIYEPTFTW